MTKTVLGVIFPIITYPYASRILGVDNMGIVTFSTSFISYFILVAGLGIATYGIREGSAFREDENKINQFVSELFTINAVATLISYLSMILIVIISEPLDKYRAIIFILSGEIIFTTLGVSWICNIYEDFYYIAIRTVVFQVLSLILIFILIRGEEDLRKYAFIILFSNSGANFCNFFYIRKHYCNFKITFHGDFKRHFKSIMTLFSTNLAVIIYVSSDTTMLGLMLDEHQVGLYGTAVKIYTIIKNILISILLVLIPRFSILFSKGEEKEKRDLLFTNVFKILSFIMLPMCTGLFMISKDMINLVFGEDYNASSQPFSLLCIAILFSLYAYLYIQCVLIPLKKEGIVLKITAVVAIINVLLNVILIPVWGITAAAITTIIAEALTFIVVFIYSRKLIAFCNIKGCCIKTIIGCIAIIFACCVSNFIQIRIIRLIVAVSSSIIVYIILMYFLKNEVLIYFKNRFSHRLEKKSDN